MPIFRPRPRPPRPPDVDPPDQPERKRPLRDFLRRLREWEFRPLAWLGALVYGWLAAIGYGLFELWLAIALVVLVFELIADWILDGIDPRDLPFHVLRALLWPLLLFFRLWR